MNSDNLRSVDPHFDELETRSPEAREGALMARLPQLIGQAIDQAPGWAKHLAGVDPLAIASRRALATLPVMRKSSLKALQDAQPPFGGLTTRPAGNLGRLFMSPGPIFEPEGEQADSWRVARALWAAGVRPGQVLQNCFSYHMTPGAWMIDQGARHLGCAVIPAGIGQTEQQLELIHALRPDSYAGTPSFLKIILERAAARGQTAPAFRRAVLAGEALPANLRAWFLEQGIATVLQFYGTADLGCVAYESTAMDGMILDEDVLLEIVRPGTGDPIPDGEVGEIVITRFNASYPMIRFATGDLSAVTAGPSACGRTNVRIRGWLGRADQTTKVRGLFVHPSQIAAVLARHPELRRARLVVSGAMASDQMTLRCETASPVEAAAAVALSERVAMSVREATKLRADVELVEALSLPNDGKIIEDLRRLD